MIKDQTELTKTINIGTSIITAYDAEQDKSVFQRASFQVGAVGVDSLEYKGAIGNEDIDVSRLSEEGQQAMADIDAGLRLIWEECKSNYGEEE